MFGKTPDDFNRITERARACCFTGHRVIPKNELSAVKNKTRKTVIALIKHGVIWFCAGGALGFDTVAAETVLEVKKDFPQIKLVLVLPCPEQADMWGERDKKRYCNLLFKADKKVYVSTEYSEGCMHKRNRRLVDISAYCVCYLRRKSGGTAYTAEYAKKTGLTIYNVAQENAF